MSQWSYAANAQQILKGRDMMVNRKPQLQGGPKKTSYKWGFNFYK